MSEIVKNFRIDKKTPQSLGFSWEAPENINGKLRNYKLSLEPKRCNNKGPDPKTTTVTSIEFNNLDIGCAYEVTVIATNGYGDGESLKITASTFTYEEITPNMPENIDIFIDNSEAISKIYITCEMAPKENAEVKEFILRAKLSAIELTRNELISAEKIRFTANNFVQDGNIFRIGPVSEFSKGNSYSFVLTAIGDLQVKAEAAPVLTLVGDKTLVQIYINEMKEGNLKFLVPTGAFVVFILLIGLCITCCFGNDEKKYKKALLATDNLNW